MREHGVDMTIAPFEGSVLGVVEGPDRYPLTLILGGLGVLGSFFIYKSLVDIVTLL